ncbi:hypothetical protein ACIHFE_18795 [Streptomyces sp. NPDC052396]|uniref:hypothetical protein n=1 Tax=Streptomyces sp. NPDC052396 TaxID=3365689 RepID=UPI0037D4DBA1
MGLFDKLTGTRYPDDGVPPRPVQELRAALLALNGPDVPWVVHTATAKERADLVAEWRVMEPAWHGFFQRNQLDRTVKTHMRLDTRNHEVRTIDHQREVTWVGNPPRPAFGGEWSRGQVTAVSRRWVVKRGPDGSLHKEEVFRFDPAEMKIPLRQTVLDAGWTWRGMLFRV